MDTFHTATSDCSLVSPNINFNLGVTNSSNPEKAMSDSGVCLDSQKNVLVNSRCNVFESPKHDSSGKTTDDDDESCFSCDNQRNNIQSYSDYTMTKLREQIAILKAQIMKNLEKESNKTELDEKIERLQELQKAYLKLEMEKMKDLNSK